MTNQTQTTNIAPGPKGAPIVGGLFEMQRKGMIEYFMENWQQYGDIVRFPMGPIENYLLAHPDDVRYVLIENKDNYNKGISMAKLRLSLGEGLFASEGQLWRKQRRLMQPMFTPRAIDQFAAAMVEDIEKLLGRWAVLNLEGQPFDVSTEMMSLAMGIIARTMFDLDIDQEAVEAGNAFTYVLEFVSQQTMRIIDLPLFIPTAANRKFKQSMQILDDFIFGIIEKRKDLPPEQQRDDLLGTLLKARDPETGEPMSLQQIRDEVVTIFFAGHETTAQALTWTWFLLAQHPPVEQKLHQELAEVLQGRMPGLQDVEQLVYTRMVIDEAMRLYPPIWVYARQAIADDVIGGYHIPAGSLISLSQFITHRHPDFWDEPEVFNPENFAPEQEVKRHKYAYFPFGGGQRICIGNNFALLEAVLALAAIAQQYRLHLLPGQDIQPKMVGTLRPNKPVMMTLEAR
ncbi:MAG: cytochrome P450 [Anaerolineales bacterium]|nr:cytochrome P450 [Anaerolineales bacterium]